MNQKISQLEQSANYYEDTGSLDMESEMKSLQDKVNRLEWRMNLNEEEENTLVKPFNLTLANTTELYKQVKRWVHHLNLVCVCMWACCTSNYNDSGSGQMQKS